MAFIRKTAQFSQKPSAEGNVTPDWRLVHQHTRTRSTGFSIATHLHKLLYSNLRGSAEILLSQMQPKPTLLQFPLLLLVS